MIVAVLILAALADLAIVTLMIGVSGFISGLGPESVHGGNLLLAA